MFQIAALSPADINYDETLSTLRYADRYSECWTSWTYDAVNKYAQMYLQMCFKVTAIFRKTTKQVLIMWSFKII